MTADHDRRERRPDRSATRREVDTYSDQVRAEAGLPPVFEAPLVIRRVGHPDFTVTVEETS